MGVFIGQSTQDLRPRDRRDPLRRSPVSVVAGSCRQGMMASACAVIVREERTRAKTSINELLRD